MDKLKKLDLFTILCTLVILTAATTYKISYAYVVVGTWGSSQATYYYHSSLPVNWQSSTDYGANVWTNVPSSSWVWSKSSGSANVIKLGTIDGAGNALGVTTIWKYDPGDIFQIEIKYDQAENWYLGSGMPGYNQYDLESTASHEFGHGLGLDHAQSQYCSSPRATMCDTQNIASTEFRSLETDDINGVVAMYP